MAAGAGIGRAEIDRKIGTRHAQAVIAAEVDIHVRCFRHVTVDALRARGADLVLVVVGRVVLACRMRVVAGNTHRVAHELQHCGMRIMTNRAAHSLAT